MGGQLGLLSDKGAVDVSDAVAFVTHELACLFHKAVRTGSSPLWICVGEYLSDIRQGQRPCSSPGLVTQRVCPFSGVLIQKCRSFESIVHECRPKEVRIMGLDDTSLPAYSLWETHGTLGAHQINYVQHHQQMVLFDQTHSYGTSVFWRKGDYG
jgi:hypothetical protein